MVLPWILPVSRLFAFVFSWCQLSMLGKFHIPRLIRFLDSLEEDLKIMFWKTTFLKA